MKPPSCVLLIALLVCTASTNTLADDDHERALDLRQHGQILPLSRILDRLADSYPGKVLKVELEEEDRSIVYEIDLLGEDGSVREIIIDAESGSLLSVEDD